jgi:hypothetical protein
MDVTANPVEYAHGRTSRCHTGGRGLELLGLCSKNPGKAVG